MMGGFNYNSNQSQGTTASNSNAASQQRVWGAQAPYLEQLYGQGAAMAGGQNQVVGPAYSSWGSALQGSINPGVQDVISRTTQQMGTDFQRSVMPQIQQQAVGTGGFGGSRQAIAEGIAMGDLARAQGDVSSQLTAGAQDRAAQERMSALGMSGMMSQLPWQNLQQFASLLGGPTTLSSSSATSNSRGQQTASGKGYGANAAAKG